MSRDSHLFSGMRAEEGASWTIQFKLKHSDKRQSSLLEQSRCSFGFLLYDVCFWIDQKYARDEF